MCFVSVVIAGLDLGLKLGSGLVAARQMSSYAKCCVCVCVAVHVMAEEKALWVQHGLQLGRVFRARDQTAAQSINTSQDRSHRRASLTTSAPLGALKTLPAPRMLLAWQSEGEELRGS